MGVRGWVQNEDDWDRYRFTESATANSWIAWRGCFIAGRRVLRFAEFLEQREAPVQQLSSFSVR